MCLLYGSGMKIRTWIQFLSTFIHNGYFGFLKTQNLYTGFFKNFCAFGLNCHSCPASLFACPLGILQNLTSSTRTLPIKTLIGPFFYIISFLFLSGILLGRFICGWLCPFGLFQELLYKIPFYKKSITLPLNFQKKFKYFILLLFIFLFPLLFLNDLGYGILWFCKFLCPAGTLEAGYLNLLLHPSLRNLISFTFYFKSFILFSIVVLCIMDLRFFCKNICPLGLIYGIFNKFSLFQLSWEKEKCNSCNICEKICPMNLSIPEELNSIECIRCLNCVKYCSKYAIKLKNILYEDEINVISPNQT